MERSEGRNDVERHHTSLRTPCKGRGRGLRVARRFRRPTPFRLVIPSPTNEQQRVRDDPSFQSESRETPGPREPSFRMSSERLLVLLAFVVIGILFAGTL